MNKQKHTKTAIEANKAKDNNTMVTKMEKPHYNKTYNCICQTSAIAIVFRNMSQEKKYIVEQIGFGALTHVPEMNVSHILLRKLIDCFDDDKGCLKTLQGNIKITPRKVAAELGINNDKERFSESETESESDKIPSAKRTRQKRVVKKQKLVDMDSETITKNESNPTDSESKSGSKNHATERRRQVLETIREKRSKKRNDGAQTVKVAPDQFDSAEPQNYLSETAIPDSELQIIEVQQETHSEPLKIPSLFTLFPAQQTCTTAPLHHERKKKKQKGREIQRAAAEERRRGAHSVAVALTASRRCYSPYHQWPPSLQSSSPASCASTPRPVRRHHRDVCAVVRESRTEKKVGSRVRVIASLELPCLRRHRGHATSPLSFSPPPSLLWLVSSPKNHHRWREGGLEKEDKTCEKGDAQRRNRSSAATAAGKCHCRHRKKSTAGKGFNSGLSSFRISKRFLTLRGCYSRRHRGFTSPLSLKVMMEPLPGRFRVVAASFC
ncbi:hypothetical protein Ahy_A04g019239 [Arachis hypogaea]|uniref:Uncharacterized protein n=1 Tax=Arachis hypogaea TaxID=3818 RepID=A0A445DFK5_ARAHY|nr:hypothetical protein Ahy_A04g019239 [Arachis hypogaea]